MGVVSRKFVCSSCDVSVSFVMSRALVRYVNIVIMKLINFDD